MWPKGKAFPISDTVAHMPPYIFHTLKEWTDEVQATGAKVTALSIGSPDQRPPPFVLDAMVKAVQNPGSDGYAPFDGLNSLKEAAAHWMKERFSVTVHPQRHIIVLIGSKEGLGNLPRALANPGDRILIPDPGYPAYQTSIHLAGVEPAFYGLTRESGYLPDTNQITKLMTPRTRAIYMNYPSNPVGTCISTADFARVTRFCLDKGLSVIHDAPYSELYRGTEAPSSVLQHCDLESEPVMEFFSFSKMMNMGGWRIGFVVGNEQMINALRTVKTHMDTGQFGAIQIAATTALLQRSEREDHLKKMRALYDSRFTAAEETLRAEGFDFIKPTGTFYMWVNTPNKMNDREWTRHLLKTSHVLVTPGTAFGPSGVNAFRITMTHAPEKVRELVQKMGQARRSL